MRLSTWPRWVAGAAAGWGLGLVALTLSWAMGGDYGRPLANFPLPAAFWQALPVLAGLAAITPLTGARSVAAAASLPVLGTFGLVMHLVAALGTGRVADWPALLVGLYCAVGSLLFIGTALARWRAGRGRCLRCGHDHEGEPVRRPAPPAVRWTAWLGAAAFLPYIAMKTVWALGVPIAGMRGPDLGGGTGLSGLLGRLGIDLTSIMALLGAVLSLALVHNWGQTFPAWTPFLAGRRVPRWLLLTPAWLGATSLGVYPFVALALLLSGADLSGAGGDMTWVAVVGLSGFGGWGITVGVAALSYQRRTRPLCSSPVR
ncbi:hypothetical protein HII36_51915 [Nonomuraea sp. NN258]|uniref:hypothetical protein n=1 Tax=Nonomuraea antri TaxID=2730852 RepID=UPI001569CB26|nr:hypothetical protein [Nonomuraea antri]NRQ40277.1 hypothetical protein [Nonomuraea antri]